MTQDTNIQNLIINKLTKAQFDSIVTPDPTQFYFITDDNGLSSLDDISLTNLTNGQILKYNITTQKWENSNITGFLQNTATGTDSITILGSAANDMSSINIGFGSSTSYDGCIAIGSEDSSVPVNGAISADMSVAIGSGYDVHDGAYADGVSVAVGTGSEAISGSVAVGYEAKASSGNNTAIGAGSIANGDWSCIAIGDNAEATAVSAIQIGSGTNNVASTLQIGNKQLLSLTTGLIPDERLSSNIARATAFVGADGTNAGTSGLVPAPTATDNTKFLKGDGTWSTVASSNALLIRDYTTS